MNKIKRFKVRYNSALLVNLLNLDDKAGEQFTDIFLSMETPERSAISFSYDAAMHDGSVRKQDLSLYINS